MKLKSKQNPDPKSSKNPLKWAESRKNSQQCDDRKDWTTHMYTH